MTLLAFAAECRAAVRRAAAAAIATAGSTVANPPQLQAAVYRGEIMGQTDGETDGRTLYRYIDVGIKGKGKGSSYSITERRVPELIPVLDSQPAGDVSHKPGGRLPLLSARPAAVNPATLKRAATNFAAW